jgi:uncharacterized membrane protein YqaE (UPF0057 family)
MTRDTVITLVIFSIFITAPFLAVVIEKGVDIAKLKINKRLAKHGLRLKARG